MNGTATGLGAVATNGTRHSGGGSVPMSHILRRFVPRRLSTGIGRRFEDKGARVAQALRVALSPARNDGDEDPLDRLRRAGLI